MSSINSRQNWLLDAGIKARTFDDEGGIIEFTESEPQVLVDEADYERAHEVVMQYVAELQNENSMDAVSDAEGQFDWPICPICDELRPAKCLKCERVSTEFSTDESDGQDKIICIACSQETEIELAERCNYCEHDFSTDDSTLRLETGNEPRDADGGRVMIVVGILVLLAIAIAVGFAIGGN